MNSSNPQEPAETVDLHRLLDASANRAREGLRVVEDYVRFVLDDALLCRELKQLRHDLGDALAVFDLRPLLASRETQHDVGTTVSTLQERDRPHLAAVAAASFKRTQEALRSLEEYSKLAAARTLLSSDRSLSVSETFEQLRYRLYTVERAVLLGAESRDRLKDVGLYVIVSTAGCRGDIEAVVRGALEGGAQAIQLREKDLADRALLDLARAVRRWTRQADALFIMNDRPDVARLSDADGVHVGQDELSVKDARRIVGPDRLVGVSTHDLDQVRRAVFDGADYLGVGPVFPSVTKQFSELAGLEFVREAVKETTLPAFAIGGITPENVGEVLRAGAERVAVSAAVCAAEDPAAAARGLRQRLQERSLSRPAITGQ
jgi:thiamine-phosphate pyrophosphorylase